MKKRNLPVRLLPLLAVAIVTMISGCDKASRPKVAKLIVTSGANQCTLPESDYKKAVMIRAEDAKGYPVGGVKLDISCKKGSELAFDKDKLVTDPGGTAILKVKSGKITGDNYLVISTADQSAKPIEARLVNGIAISGSDQEGLAGRLLKEPLTVKIVDGNGVPRKDVAVYVKGNSGAKPARESLKTDSDGVASTEIKLPDTTGTSILNIEILSGTDNPVRTIESRALSINVGSLLISIFGGLAIFILGMKMLDNGLTKIAGEKLKSILRFCVKNKFVALIAGMFVTAAIQSSSATTVMVIGFVNAGLMTLAQSIGVIFGANIGTTITAQMVSFKLDSLAMPAVIAGVLMLFLPWKKLGGWADAILGFGFLFYGMGMMSSDLKSIGSFPTFINFFQTFDCAPVNGLMPILPLIGTIIIGIIATVVVQSSSAVTGIVIALGAGGLINLYTAVALIFGSNIGTTITAQLAAIPGNKIAKQTALAHTLFNVLGVAIVTATFWIPWGDTGIPIFFYAVNSLTDGNAFAEVPQNLPRHIANAHTLFNIVTAVILFPLINVLAVICAKAIPVGEDKVRFSFLEPLLLETPGLALDQTVIALGKMMKKSWKMIDSAVNDCFIPLDVNSKTTEKIRKREQNIDRYQYEIMQYLSKVMRHNISTRQSDRIPPLMHCTNDAERIGDRAENIIRIAERMKETNRKLSNDGVKELNQIFGILKDQAKYTLNTLELPRTMTIEMVNESEKTVVRMAANFEDAHISRVRDGKCDAETGILYVELLSELVAVSRHLSNVAERSILIRERK
ncbi:MAG: Na/Pi cotransporter family protein [Lentisphaeria bacterium]|nr:Na/Pi cotransporter family protein [Lentisphaeria bacterium]